MIIGITDENYKTHDFDKFSNYKFSVCKVCEMKLYNLDGFLISENGDVSCVEYMIKSIIE